MKGSSKVAESIVNSHLRKSDCQMSEARNPLQEVNLEAGHSIHN